MKRTDEIDTTIKKAEAYGTPTYTKLVAYVRELEGRLKEVTKEALRQACDKTLFKSSAEAAEEREVALLEGQEALKRGNIELLKRAEAAEKRVKELEAVVQAAVVVDRDCAEGGEDPIQTCHVELRESLAALRAKSGIKTKPLPDYMNTDSGEPDTATEGK